MPNNHIHTIDPNGPGEQESTVTGYGQGAKEVDPTSHSCLAKKCRHPEGGFTYFLKRATAGPDAGRLYNTQSPNFNEAASERQYSATGRYAYEFRQASEESFRQYLRFLETGDPRFIRHAERA